MQSDDHNDQDRRRFVVGGTAAGLGLGGLGLGGLGLGGLGLSGDEIGRAHV
mgnify:CR=1 FL=1